MGTGIAATRLSMDTTGEETNATSATDGGSDDAKRMQSQPDEDGQGGGTSQLRGLVRRAMRGVERRAREKPMVALAAASGLGYVLGRGLPRIGMLALLGGGGMLATLGIPALRRRMMGMMEGHDDDSASSEDDPRESLDVGGSTSGARSRRKKRGQSAAAGA